MTTWNGYDAILRMTELSGEIRTTITLPAGADDLGYAAGSQFFAIPPRGSLREADLATREAYVHLMLVDGWTPAAAWDHIEGSCDIAVCGHGDHVL